MHGVANAQIVLTSPSGKTKYKISFTGGVTHAREKVPAKCITDSPIIQGVIENDPLFNKKIFLLNSFGTPEKPAAPAVASAKGGKPSTPAKGGKPSTPAKSKETVEEPKGPKVYEEVTNLGEAITVLMQEGTVPGDSMTSVSGVLKAASELGISFPNLTEE